MVVLEYLQEDLWSLNTRALWQHGGKKTCSEGGGGGDGGGDGKGLYHSAVSWQMKQTVICRKHLSPLSSPPIIDTKHIFFQRKTRHSHTLTHLIRRWVTLLSLRQVFFVQIRCVVNLQFVLKLHWGESCVKWKCSVCLLYFVFQSKSSLWIVPLLLFRPYYQLFNKDFFFVSRKLAESFFYEGTKTKVPQKFLWTSHHVEFWSFSVSFSTMLFLVGQSVYAI